MAWSHRNNHIWPKWLQIEIGGNTKGISQGVHLNYFNPYNPDIRIQSGESLVFGSVCNKCNNGWMSLLEAGSMQIIRSLLKSPCKIKTLKKGQRHTLSRWAFKTALMINAGSNYRKIIPDSHYKHLYKFQTLPKNMKVDLSQIEGKNELLWRQSQFSMAVLPEIMFEKYQSLRDGSYRITMQIKCIGIRLSFFPRAKEPGFSIVSSDLRKVIRIWPFQKNSTFNCSDKFVDIDDFDLSIGITANQ